MVEAVRNADYLDALHWLNTLAAVEPDFSLTSYDVLESWRARAKQFRSGDATPEGADLSRAEGYRGLFSSLLEHSRDGIVINDVDSGWMLECSRSFAAMTGYALRELIVDRAAADRSGGPRCRPRQDSARRRRGRVPDPASPQGRRGPSGRVLPSARSRRRPAPDDRQRHHRSPLGAGRERAVAGGQRAVSAKRVTSLLPEARDEPPSGHPT
jgi:PAS domain-containing protein